MWIQLFKCVFCRGMELPGFLFFLGEVMLIVLWLACDWLSVLLSVLGLLLRSWTCFADALVATLGRVCSFW